MIAHSQCVHHQSSLSAFLPSSNPPAFSYPFISLLKDSCSSFVNTLNAAMLIWFCFSFICLSIISSIEIGLAYILKSATNSSSIQFQYGGGAAPFTTILSYHFYFSFNILSFGAVCHWRRGPICANIMLYCPFVDFAIVFYNNFITSLLGTDSLTNKQPVPLYLIWNTGFFWCPFILISNVFYRLLLFLSLSSGQHTRDGSIPNTMSGLAKYSNLPYSLCIDWKIFPCNPFTKESSHLKLIS